MPFSVLESSLQIVSLPTLNATVLPSRSYFGSFLTLYFINLVMPPVLCFSNATICFNSVEFSENSATFQMPTSENKTTVSLVSTRINNPDFLIGTISSAFELSKSLKIHRISSPLSPQVSSFFVHGADFWAPCRVRSEEGSRELLGITVVNSTTLSANWLVEVSTLWNNMSSLAFVLSCHSCNTIEPWCHPGGPAAFVFFNLELTDQNNVILGGSPSAHQLLLRHVTSARPFSIKVDTSSPINITVGDEKDVAIELIASGDRSVVDSAVLAGSAILVTKDTNSGLELGSLFYRGSKANYKLRQVRAENVSLHFEDLGLGGILATYYRDAKFSAPFASGVQEQPLLRAQSNIISHSNSFRWTWLMRASVNAG